MTIGARLAAITFSSWIVSPLALLVAQTQGFIDSKEVIIFLFTIATQAPFLVLLNEAVAPVVAKKNTNMRARLLPVILISAALFSTLIYSLNRIDAIKMKLQDGLVVSAAAALGAMISYASTTHLLKQILSHSGEGMSKKKLFVAGMMPGAITLVVFAIYAIIYQTYSLSPIFLTLMAILLPSVAHFIFTSLCASGGLSYHQEQLSDANILQKYKVLGACFLACLFLPCVVYWSNSVREKIAIGGGASWLILLTNLLFSAMLLMTKINFLSTNGVDAKSLKNKKCTTFLISGLLVLLLIYLAALNLKLDVRTWIFQLVSLALSYFLTLVAIVKLRNYLAMQ